MDTVTPTPPPTAGRVECVYHCVSRAHGPADKPIAPRLIPAACRAGYVPELKDAKNLLMEKMRNARQARPEQ